MILKTYPTARAFLEDTRTAMEADEAVNSLMYGLTLRAQQFPERIQIPHYYAGVFDGGVTRTAVAPLRRSVCSALTAEPGPAGGAVFQFTVPVAGEGIDG